MLVLGSRAMTVSARLQQLNASPTSVIIDSGSDITLISQKALSTLSDAPRPRIGQKVKLIQVTGNTTISGYVPLTLFFDTEAGPVKIKVEAYVVKGMSAPLILGNDFTEQYSISLLRQGGETRVQLGDSGRTISAMDALADDLQDEDGHAFQVCVRSLTSSGDKAQARRLRRQKVHHREPRDTRVRAKEACLLHPGFSRRIPITVHFPTDVNSVYVEKLLESPKNNEEFYGPPDSLISRQDPFLHISNFTSKPVCIEKGQTLGYSRNYQDHPKQILNRISAHAQLVRRLAELEGKNALNTATVQSRPVELKATQRIQGSEDPLAEEPLEGGPKTSEAPPEDTPSSSFLESVDISTSLNKDQHRRLTEVLISNKDAFSLDGRLGTVASECTIPLCPGVKEVSLPPFPSSPAKREVMDKQMDTWIQLGVIESSTSPWGAPGFIVYRNSKPRMVIDYRKLNDLTIPDEFPLPRQEDIMHALSGAQWLSTMDALSGFTQVLIREEDRSKTAFRTHRGLYQFRRMPFGLRNGPSIFQRIMQSVLAPYLWIFTLVYIDDIVVYSKTFDEHLEHLKAVLQAVSTAGITLSPSKCHSGYHSLMLLGQKVSRLGLSTHKDKVDAIVQLAPPKV